MCAGTNFRSCAVIPAAVWPGSPRRTTAASRSLAPGRSPAAGSTAATAPSTPAIRVRAFHVAEFDAVAADLDPVVGAADELDQAVGQVAHQIAGAVPGSTVMLDEPFGRQIRPAAVAAGDATAGHPELAGHPVGTVGPVAGHHSAGVVGQRTAQWHRHPGRRDVAGLADGVVGRGFGGPAQSGEPDRGCQCPPRRTSSGRTQSPPVGITRTESSCPAATSASISSQPGMKRSTLTLCRRISSAQLSGLRRCSSSTTTIEPPARRVPKMSSTDRSHSRVDSARQRAAGPSQKWGVDEFDGVHRRRVGDLDGLGFTRRPGGRQDVGHLRGIDCGGRGFADPGRSVRSVSATVLDGTGNAGFLRPADQATPHTRGDQDPPARSAG